MQSSIINPSKVFLRRALSSTGRLFSSAKTPGDGAQVFTDSNVPSNPAYHFKILPPGAKPTAGWVDRKTALQSASIGTHCIHAGQDPDPAFGAVTPPIYNTSTFAFFDVCTTAGYDYTRSGNPTRANLEHSIAALEGGEGAACTSTGMSAILLALNLLPHGSHVICTIDCYGGTFRTLNHCVNAYGMEVSFIDLRDTKALKAAIRPNTKMIWLETPSNPLLRVTEIAPVAAIAKSIGALTVVDNTFLSPILQRPLEFGADLVMHSSTKYLNGHSDIVGGALVAKKGDKVLFQKIASMNNLLGTSQSPHDCAMIHRGIKTLKVRMLAHQANARGIAKYLRQHRAVARVNYPDIGAMLSFELKNGQQEAVNSVLRGLRFFTLAESLGGVESLVAHPASMTHASMTPEARKAAGISDGLIRLSVGIEDEADLVNDLKRVLDPL